MGVFYNEPAHSKEEMEKRSSSVYVQGKQIMPVSLYVKEIGELRRAYQKKKYRKSGYGGLLPVVRVERCSVELIKEKTKRAVTGPSNGRIEVPSNKEIEIPSKKFEWNGVIETSDEDADDPEPVADENPPATPKSQANDALFEDSSSGDESDESLPDISDPTYYGGMGMKKRKKKMSLFGKTKEQLEKKKKFKPLSKYTSFSLMKAARQNCLEKQKMFAISDKDKRLSKASPEPDKSSFPSTELLPMQMPQPYKQIGFVQLKPNAKSPKDVERSNEKSSKKAMLKNSFKGDTQMEREKLCQVMQRRLQSPPLQNETNLSHAVSSPEDTLKAKSNTLDQDDQTDGYNSDETIAYKADVQQRNTEALSEDFSPLPTDTLKRKNPYDLQGIKKLNGSEEFSGPFIVGSPVAGADLEDSSPHVMETSNDLMEGEHHIVIGDVKGGVAETFENSPPSSVSIHQQLGQKYSQKEELNNLLKSAEVDMDNKLQKLKEMYDKTVKEVKNNHDLMASNIKEKLQKIDEEIKGIVFQLTSAPETPKENQSGNGADDSRGQDDAPMEPVRDPLEVVPVEEVFVNKTREKKLNVISAASIAKFGASHHVIPTTLNQSSPATKTKESRPSNTGSSKSLPIEGNRATRHDQFIPQNPVQTPSKQIAVEPISSNKTPAQQQQLSSVIPSSVQLSANSVIPHHQSAVALTPPVLPLFQNVQSLQENQTQPVLQAILPVSMATSSGSQAQLFIRTPQQNAGSIIIAAPSGVPFNPHRPGGTIINNSLLPKTTNATRTPMNTVMGSTYPMTSTMIAPNAPQTIRRPPPPSRVMKPHLMVKPPPPVSSTIMGTQAKTQPPNTTGPITPHPATKAPTNLTLQIPSVRLPNDEENLSPEAEQSCFLCGSPGEFVCCNRIVYCSQDCKSKDWSRHSGECSRNSSN